MSGEQTTRRYDSPLRDRRAAETRELVLESVAALISERGTTEFAVQEVADRAGVSLRTVYRHFSNRQALLDGLAGLIDERLAAVDRDDQFGWRDPEERTLDDLMRSVPAVFERLDELVPLSSAMVLLSAGGHLRAERHDERTDLFREILSEHLEDMDDERAQRSFAVVRHLVSSATWFALREEFGLDGRAAGEAVVRTVRAVLDGEA